MRGAVKFVCLLVFIATTYSVPVPKADPNYHLTGNVSPSNYQIKLTLDADLATYTGSVVISLTTSLDNILSIDLHSKVKTITSLSYQKEEAAAQDITPIPTPDAITDILQIPLPVALEKGVLYKLNIGFEGELSSTSMDGFYKSTYVEGDVTKSMAATQFESTSARSAFPCFDEPAFKAKFDIKLSVPTAYKTVLTNAVQIARAADTDTPSNELVEFKTTPQMSTYLVAFIVTEFECADGALVDTDVKTYICSRVNADTTKNDWQNWAKKVASQVINGMEAYTNNIMYNHDPAVEKLHEVAIPDFAAGAMENWGLVTYRESALLWDPDDSSEVYKQRVGTVVAHELAHQWFGDLVTLKWWNDVFLNEGFATYFEYHVASAGVANDMSTWNLPKQFVVENVQTALEYDATSASLPLHTGDTDTNSPSQISARFDSISYNKGGSILKMVESIMTLDKFKVGLNTYLKDTSNGNADADRLWAKLAENQDLSGALPQDTTLANVMENWTKKKGFPLVTVIADGDNVIVNQKPVNSDDDTITWMIPLTYSTDQDTSTAAEWLLDGSNKTLTGVTLQNKNWIILNNQQTGYYRVNYSPELWQKIITALSDDTQRITINELNRAQIVDDSFCLTQSDIRTYADLFEIVAFLKSEESYYPWYPAFRGFNTLLNNIGSDTLTTSVIGYISNLLTTLYEKVRDTTPTDHVEILKKALVSEWACKIGNTVCTTEAQDLFTKYIAAEPTSVDVNKRSYVYCYGLRAVDSKVNWDALWAKYQATDNPSEQNILLKALGCSKNADALAEYLGNILKPYSESKIRPQDVKSAYSSVYSSSSEGIDATIKFLKDQYANIALDTVKSLIGSVSAKFTKQTQMDSLKAINDITDVDPSVTAAITAAEEKFVAKIAKISAIETQLTAFFATSEPDGAVGITVSSTTLLLTVIVAIYQLI